MKGVELYGRVRCAVQIEGLSHREAARQFGIDPRTVAKMVKFSVPPGYVRKKPPARPKLDPFILVIAGILLDDKSRPKKQQHTAKRIFERLRDEYGFRGVGEYWVLAIRPPTRCLAKAYQSPPVWPLNRHSPELYNGRTTSRTRGQF